MCGLTQRFQVVKYVYYCKFCAKVFMLKCKYQSYINVSQLELALFALKILSMDVVTRHNESAQQKEHTINNHQVIVSPYLLVIKSKSNTGYVIYCTSLFQAGLTN